jgi:hypothetical protein
MIDSVAERSRFGLAEDKCGALENIKNMGKITTVQIEQEYPVTAYKRL